MGLSRTYAPYVVLKKSLPKKDLFYLQCLMWPGCLPCLEQSEPDVTERKHTHTARYSLNSPHNWRP